MERLCLSSPYGSVEASIHLSRYAAARSVVNGKSVLDLGCGEGYGAAMLSQWGASRVVGLDRSEEAIRQATRLFSSAKVEFIYSDVEEIAERITGPFDVVVAFELIEHVKDPAGLLHLIRQLSAPNTVVMISCPNDYYYYGRGRSLNKYHLNAFSWYDFRSLTERHLGEAKWLFGCPINGFGCFPIEYPPVTPENFENLPSSVAQGELALVPSPMDESRPTPSKSFFYLGVWPVETEVSAASVAGFAGSADYRLPMVSNVSPDVRAGKRRRLAFIIDMENWAFDNVVNNISAYISDRYDIDKHYIGEYEDKSLLMKRLFIDEDYDNIHFMWREFFFNFLMYPKILASLLRSTRLSPAEIAAKVAAPVITSTVYDHLNLAPEQFKQRSPLFAVLDGYSVASETLRRLYAERAWIAPSGVTEDGVDLDLFRPINRDRFDGSDRPLVVGWAGNSKWAHEHPELGADPKGFHSILIPAIAELEAEGLAIKGHFADRQVQWRPREEMPEYYSQIDVLVCASEVEGTPNPVLEAMACGVPVISTDVGVLRSVSGPLQSEYILAERSKDHLKAALRRLYEDRSLLRALSQENLRTIQTWTWHAKAPAWLHLFASAELRSEQNAGLKYFALQQVTHRHLVAQRLSDLKGRRAQQSEKTQETLKPKGRAQKQKRNRHQAPSKLSDSSDVEVDERPGARSPGGRKPHAAQTDQANRRAGSRSAERAKSTAAPTPASKPAEHELPAKVRDGSGGNDGPGTSDSGIHGLAKLLRGFRKR